MISPFGIEHGISKMAKVPMPPELRAVLQSTRAAARSKSVDIRVHRRINQRIWDAEDAAYSAGHPRHVIRELQDRGWEPPVPRVKKQPTVKPAKPGKPQQLALFPKPAKPRQGRLF